MSKWNGRVHGRDRRQLERQLDAAGLGEDAVFSILWLATEFGRVTVDTYDKTEYGDRVSLTVGVRTAAETKDIVEFSIETKEHPYG